MSRRRLTTDFLDVPEANGSNAGRVASVRNSDLTGCGKTIPEAFNDLISHIAAPAVEKVLRVAGEVANA